MALVQRLSSGDNITHGALDRLQAGLNKLFGLKPQDYDQPKAKAKLTWLKDVSEVLDPTSNPDSYKSCQESALSRGAVPILLGLAEKAASDCVRSNAAEVLARLAFGNPVAAGEVACHPAFAPTLLNLLGGPYPEQLGGLQFAQAVMASQSPKIAGIVPEVVAAVAPKLFDTTFPMIPRAALEVLVSASFHSATDVAGAVSFPFLASVVAEDNHRPEWLPVEPLPVLTCGMLATNLLGSQILGMEEEQGKMANRLSNGHFVENLLFALDAAADRRAWPVESSAFHSPSRLAEVVFKLAKNGYEHRLLNAVAPLTKVVCDMDDVSAISALQALQALSVDFPSIEAMLSDKVFREALVNLKEEPSIEESTKSQAHMFSKHLDDVDSMMLAAQAVAESSAKFMPNAPSMRTVARIFSEFSPLDGALSQKQLLELLSRLSVGPIVGIKTSLGGKGKNKDPKFDLEAVATRLYGTPSVLGWWPSLMEDAAALLASRKATSLVPPLGDLMTHFERGAHGKISLHAQALLDEVLPGMGWPMDTMAVEAAFAELRGDVKLEFYAFVKWLVRVGTEVEDERARFGRASSPPPLSVFQALDL